MRKFTQEEFNNFEFSSGYRNCPTGDYSLIKVFPNKCNFEINCKFAECSVFGEECDFGCFCEFGKCCSFGWYCIFDMGCKFDKMCKFGDNCKFGVKCAFENRGHYIGAYPFIAYIGARSRKGDKLYIFNLETGIYARCDFFAGTINNFENRVKTKNLDSDYLVICKLAKKKFKNNN